MTVSKKPLEKTNLVDQLTERSAQDVLVNSGININQTADENDQRRVTLALTYKIAAEVGRLGDNIRFIRKQIKDDGILQRLASFSHEHLTISAHTRWASVGAISEPNCHPVDNKLSGNSVPESGIIHACLNGDIDNYLELKKEHERQGLFYTSRYHHRYQNHSASDRQIYPARLRCGGSFSEGGE